MATRICFDPSCSLGLNLGSSSSDSVFCVCVFLLFFVHRKIFFILSYWFGKGPRTVLMKDCP